MGVKRIKMISIGVSRLVLNGFLLLPLAGMQNAWALDEVALVNGQVITQQTLDLLGYSRERLVGEGAPPQTPQLVKDLITTELLFQQAKKQHLEQDPLVATELALAEKTLLSQLYIMRFMESLNISEEELQAEYVKQKDQTMFQVKRFVFQNQQDAQRYFDAQASAKTLNADRPQPEGLLVEEVEPWTSSEAMPPMLAAQLANLEKNQFLDMSIQDGEHWLLIQLVDKSVIEKPPFEEAREYLHSDLAQQRVAEHIDALARSAEMKVLVPGVELNASWFEN